MRMEKTQEENGDEKMNDLKQIGANIRSLRRAYGETQEQLSYVFDSDEKKAKVSVYENGDIKPSLDKMIAIILTASITSRPELGFQWKTQCNRKNLNRQNGLAETQVRSF